MAKKIWTQADVDAVKPDENGKNRKERKAKTYLKIRESELAIVLKLADRIANVRNAKAKKLEFFDMYKEEHPAFREALLLSGASPCLGSRNRPFSVGDMWQELDDLLS